jgi:DNA polymerase I-like protein with 3'-5' exonuclease and polymerase domains
LFEVVYGLVYGIGAKSLSEQLGVAEDEAARFMDNFKVIGDHLFLAF